jgi:tetratricopeptide (TPR) repeat protein
MATDGAIEVARGLQLQGRMIEAEALYRDLLGKQPDALKALEGLGVVLFQQGRAEEAAALFARGVAIEPHSVRFHANLRAKDRHFSRFASVYPGLVLFYSRSEFSSTARILRSLMFRI